MQSKWIVDLGPRQEFETVLGLSPGLHPLYLRMFGFLPGGRAVGNVMLRLEPNQVRVEARGREKTLDIPGPYDLFLPFSWFLSSMVRRETVAPSETFPIRLVFLVEDNPIGMIPFDAEVQFLGEETVEVAAGTHRATKFEVRTQVFNILVWLSEDGLMLAMQQSSKPEQRMELVRFKKHADFDPANR
ncbi:MAG: hypothetical protein V3R29_12100 [Candidatus Acidoferrales bacterium]